MTNKWKTNRKTKQEHNSYYTTTFSWKSKHDKNDKNIRNTKNKNTFITTLHFHENKTHEAPKNKNNTNMKNKQNKKDQNKQMKTKIKTTQWEQIKTNINKKKTHTCETKQNYGNNNTWNNTKQTN